MRCRSASLVLVALLQVGCYNYLPLRRSTLVPSSYLAVTLTESGSEELARYLGPNPFVVRGRYLSATERGLAISVESVECAAVTAFVIASRAFGPVSSGALSGGGGSGPPPH